MPANPPTQPIPVFYAGDRVRIEIPGGGGEAPFIREGTIQRHALHHDGCYLCDIAGLPEGFWVHASFLTKLPYC